MSPAARLGLFALLLVVLFGTGFGAGAALDPDRGDGARPPAQVDHRGGDDAHD